MVAIYAVFPSLLNPDFAQEILFACQPLLKEGNLSANSYQELLNATMILYGKSLANIQFLVGDNCSVNRCLADYFDNSGVPLIGCASHLIHLAVSRIFDRHSELIAKISEICRSLKTIKGSSYLRDSGCEVIAIKN